jgi:ATP-dependent Clp protease protease subunit
MLGFVFLLLLSLSLVKITLTFHTSNIFHHRSASRVMHTRLDMSGQGRVPIVPYIPDKARPTEYMWMDIYNALGRERKLFVGRFIDDETSNQLIASLVWLNSQSDEPITIYFNVPGALGKPAWAIYDVMKKLSCPVITINTGLTVGMGALLCAAGTPGRRFAMPNSRFLMAKAGLDDGLEGDAVGLGIAVKDVMRDNTNLIRHLGLLIGQPVEKLTRDLKRDFYLTAAEASAYGVVDSVLVPHFPVKIMRSRGDDDDVVGFGHFSEVRPVKHGFSDENQNINNIKTEEDSDEFATEEMLRKGRDPRKSERPSPQSLKNGGGVNRFAGSRCRPPGRNSPVPKSGGGNGNGADDDGEFSGGNRFKNAF